MIKASSHCMNHDVGSKLCCSFVTICCRARGSKTYNNLDCVGVVSDRKTYSQLNTTYTEEPINSRYPIVSIQAIKEPPAMSIKEVPKISCEYQQGQWMSASTVVQRTRNVPFHQDAGAGPEMLSKGERSRIRAMTAQITRIVPAAKRGKANAEKPNGSREGS